MSVRARDLGPRLRAIAGGVRERADRVHRAAAIEALNALAVSTPVDTGRLRSGWDVAVDRDSDFVPPPGIDAGIGAIVARGSAAISQAAPLRRITISNNVEYAATIETGGMQPANPGPSKDPRPGRTGAIFVAGGYLTRAPQGLLNFAIVAVERVVRDLEAAGGRR